MAHAHAHAHAEEGNTYFLDQLFTILACGGIGLVAVLMYQTGMLNRILVPMFFVPVLIGGVALLALVVVRAVAVWQLAGARRAEAEAAGHDHGHSHAHEDCGHDHSHGADCEHDHGHSHSHSHSHAHAHTHDHGGGDDHGHDHGWAPWRYMVIAIPVFLFFLGLPREGLNAQRVESGLSGQLQHNPNRQALSFLAGSPALTKALRKGEPRRLELRFKELTEAAALPARHEIYEGDIGVIRGQFVPMRSSDREFTLLRVNRTCCVADEVYLETRIQAPEAIVGIEPYQWIQVEGIISFQQNDRGKWIPVITLKGNEALTPTEGTLDANAF